MGSKFRSHIAFVMLLCLVKDEAATGADEVMGNSILDIALGDMGDYLLVFRSCVERLSFSALRMIGTSHQWPLTFALTVSAVALVGD